MNSIIKVECDRALHCFHFEAPKIRRVSSSHTSAVVVLIDNIVSYFCSPKRTLSGINVHKTLIGNTKEHTSGYAMLFLEVHQEITLSTWDKNSFNPTLLDFISDQIAFCVNFSFFFLFFCPWSCRMFSLTSDLASASQELLRRACLVSWEN